VLLDTMFELPSMQGVEEVVVNEECILRKGEPLLIYADRKEGSASAS
jgi:ATP-dependent Clp protease ATP-binding subunit ClpX